MKTVIGRSIVTLGLVVAVSAPVMLQAASTSGRSGILGVGEEVGGESAYRAQAQPAQEEFVPIDELPPEDQLPAAPLLVAAYGVAWVALLAYLWSIWRRLARVEQELADVARRVTDRGRSA